MPSYNFTFVTIKSNETENIPQTLEIKKGTQEFIRRDSAWTILKKDYIEEYIDYDFVYINDSYYRVDWRWNNEYVRDVLRDCITLEYSNQQECIKNISASNIISFNAVKIKEFPYYLYAENVSQKCSELDGEENLNCRKNLAKHYLDKANLEASDFAESFFPGKSIASLKNDINYLKNNDIPREVIKGNAEIIDNINLLTTDKGSFYIELKDGFYNSNGVRVKWGINSTLAEFDNGQTSVDITFSAGGGSDTSTHIQIFKRNTTVYSATMNVTGYLTTGSDGLACAGSDLDWLELGRASGSAIRQTFTVDTSGYVSVARYGGEINGISPSDADAICKIYVNSIEKGSEACVIESALGSGDRYDEVDLNTQVNTMVHEIAHELLHNENKELSKQHKEIQAEGTAYVVTKYFGLENKSFNYLALYDADYHKIMENLKAIAEASKEIIEFLENTMVM